MKKNYGILKYSVWILQRVTQSSALLQWTRTFLQGRCWTMWIKISQFHEEVVLINDRDLCSYVYHDFGWKIMQKGVTHWSVPTNQSGNIKILPVPFVMLDKYFQKILNEAIGVQIIFFLSQLLYYLVTQASLGSLR